MALEVSCPKGHRLQVAETDLGKQVRCPICNESFLAAASSGSAAGSPPAAPAGSPSHAWTPAPEAVGGWTKFGRPLVLIGLILVLGARGCDVLGRAGVKSAKLKAELAKNQFGDEWQAKEDALSSEIDALEERIRAIDKKETKTDADRTRKEDYSKEQTKKEEEGANLPKEKAAKEKDLQRHEWRNLQTAARDAQGVNDMSSYWRAFFLTLGTIVLGIGLLAVSWTAHGAERWVSLIILAVIIFSVYVVGFAWMALP